VKSVLSVKSVVHNPVNPANPFNPWFAASLTLLLAEKGIGPREIRVICETCSLNPGNPVNPFANVFNY
jgi:hypothetical protein